MMIFVGLGNSESRYLSTKHNAGFWMMDKFAESHDMDFKPGKGNYIFAKKGSEFLLVKPTTGMNNSGSIIREVLNFYKADIKDLVVVFDDVDLNKVKFLCSKPYMFAFSSPSSSMVSKVPK